MLASMIGNHAQINCLPESHFIANLAERDVPVRELLSLIEQHARFRLWALELSAKDRETLNASPDFPSLIDQLATLYGVMEQRPNQPIWLDHTPLNVGAFIRLAKLYPNAKFIHMVRDGRAVAASWLPQDWGPRHILTIADTWSRRMAQGLAAEIAMPDKVVRLQYEDVVADPHSAMRKVSDFLGIAYSDQMLLTGGFALPAHSRKTHKMLDGDGAVSKDRIDAWMHKLDRRQIELFEYRTGDLLSALGYVRTIADAKGPTPIETAFAHIAEITGRGANLLFKNKRHGFGFSLKRAGAT